MKRRSGTSRRRPNRQQPEYCFFTDRDLARRLPRILNERGRIQVVGYDAAFDDPRVDDEVWIRYAAERNLISISCDTSTLGEIRSLDAILRYGAKVFFVNGNWRPADNADLIEACVPKMVRLVKKADPGVPVVRTLVWYTKKNSTRKRPKLQRHESLSSPEKIRTRLEKLAKKIPTT